MSKAYDIVIASSAKRDAKKLSKSYLKRTCEDLIEIIKRNPYEPPYERLNGEFGKYISRRINDQHRLCV